MPEPDRPSLINIFRLQVKRGRDMLKERYSVGEIRKSKKKNLKLTIDAKKTG